jgi:hypothetical protein
MRTAAGPGFILGLVCFFILVSCDKLQNPYTDYSCNPYPVIQIAVSDLSSAYIVSANKWSWKFQAALTETNGVSVTITELMARVYFNRSWPLGEVVYAGCWELPANGILNRNIVVLSNENIDRIKVFFEGEDENGNRVSGAQNFYPWGRDLSFDTPVPTIGSISLNLLGLAPYIGPLRVF